MNAIFRNKPVVIVLILAILVSSALIINKPVAAADFKDLNQCADYARPAVERLAQSGIISGYDGYFYPEQTVTRAQMITLIVKSLGLDNISPEHTDTFKDVPSDHWANKYVEIAFQYGITGGVAPDEFGVDQTCTREQMVTLFVNTFKWLDEEFTDTSFGLIDLTKYTDEAQISSWARNSISFSVYTGLISGTSATTIGPKTGAERQQVAVLIDNFMGRKDNILKDMQAQRILGKTILEQVKGQGISNTGDLDIKLTLPQIGSDLPGEINIKAHVINEMVWSDMLHQSVSADITGLPIDGYSKLDAEQYFVDGVLYQKIPDKNNQPSWVRTSSSEVPALGNLMQIIENAQRSKLLLPDEIHQSGQVKVEDEIVNGTNGHKISYEGQITNVSGLLDKILTAALSAGVDTGKFENMLDSVKQSVKSISLSEVFYVGEDNLIYGSDLSITIDTSNSNDLPIRNIVLTISTDNYKYQDISIVLPAEAQETP